MQINRLRLVNFRQHEETDLVFDRGLTGVIGPNGAGKTTLLEAIAWAMYGMPAARGSRDTIRRRGAPPRARVEVDLEFQLGSHQYRIVRTLSQAELFQDGDSAPIANSLGAVSERVTRLLGMSRDEFFNTYFTGQKELATMAAMTAPERAQFLSRVLGYEKLRTAQQRLKDRRRATQAAHDALETALADPGRLALEEALAETRLRTAEGDAARLEAAAKRAEAALAALRPEAERWETLQQRVVSLQGDLRLAEHGAEAARTQFARLDKELADALAAKARLDELLPRLDRLGALRAERETLDAHLEAASARRGTEARLGEIRRQLERLRARLAQVAATDQPAATALELGKTRLTLEQAAAEAEVRRTAWVRDQQDAETQRKHLLDQYEDLQSQLDRLRKAGPEGDCPTCGRPLGAGFKDVVESLERQIEDIRFNGQYYRQRIEQLKAEPVEVTETADARTRAEQEVARLTALAGRLEQESAERGRLEAEGATLASQAAELEGALAGTVEPYDEARHQAVKQRIAALEPQSLLAERLRAAAERGEELVPRAAEAEQELSQREAKVRELRATLEGLGWSPELFGQARARVRDAEEAVQRAAISVARAAGELTAALGYRAEVARKREERDRRAREVQALKDDLVLQYELDRALGDLRTDLNNTLRPDLSDLASSFLRDLTTGRYSDLDLDEEYLATIVDDGVPKRVLSGGEEDVANLALRLAISQMIAERAGQPLSLLVLDEIFGSLDEERRTAVLDLLRALADRFPQVILITHIEGVRDGVDRVIRISYDVERGAARAEEELPPRPELHGVAA